MSSESAAPVGTGDELNDGKDWSSDDDLHDEGLGTESEDSLTVHEDEDEDEEAEHAIGQRKRRRKGRMSDWLPSSLVLAMKRQLLLQQESASDSRRRRRRCQSLN